MIGFGLPAFLGKHLLKVGYWPKDVHWTLCHVTVGGSSFRINRFHDYSLELGKHAGKTNSGSKCHYVLFRGTVRWREIGAVTVCGGGVDTAQTEGAGDWVPWWIRRQLVKVCARHVTIRGPPQVISVLEAGKGWMDHEASKTQPNAFCCTMPSWECGCHSSLLKFHGYLEFSCGTACICLQPGRKKWIKLSSCWYSLASLQFLL